MLGKLVHRHEKIAYYSLIDEEGLTVFRKMCGFTKMDISKNPQEYKRRYIDEKFEQSDVVAFSPSISFSFDRYSGNLVHDDIVKLADSEAVGTEAVRTIVIADLSTLDENGYVEAVMRDFSVMVETEGDSLDAYTISGVMNAKGDKVLCKAALSIDHSALALISDE